MFTNEYVYIQGDEETRQSIRLRNLLSERLNNKGEVAPLLLAAVGAYFPLYRVPEAEHIRNREWPTTVDRLVRQQVREPLEEINDHPAIPRLTAIEDSVSMQVMHQYEENPYPRWIIDPHTAIFTEANAQQANGDFQFHGEILIAGCGTGLHASQVAHQNPKARILAIRGACQALRMLGEKFARLACIMSNLLKRTFYSWQRLAVALIGLRPLECCIIWLSRGTAGAFSVVAATTRRNARRSLQ